MRKTSVSGRHKTVGRAVRSAGFWCFLIMALMPALALADPGIPVLSSSPAPGGGQNYSLTLQILVLMTLLTVLPAIVMMMTAFTRIIIVFSILRQAIGLQQTPSNQILVGLALFLTLFIMRPVFEQAYSEAWVPYQAGKITTTQAMDNGIVPFRKFMLKNVREDDLAVFIRLSGKKHVAGPESVDTLTLIPAFVTSEMKTAFQIGFLLFIPFLIIDMVVASVLMAMGMMMLSPMVISLPFKLMLFVMVDGWSLLVGTLAASYGL